MYEQAQGAGGAAGAGPDMSGFAGAGPDMGAAGSAASDGPAPDDVVDGDFKEV